MANHFDFYSSLELDSGQSSNSLNGEIQGRLNRLSADGAPESSAEVQQLLIAAKILGDEELRSRYDDRLADEYAPAMGAGDLRALAGERRFPDEVPALESSGPPRLSAPAYPTPSPGPAQSDFPPSGPVPSQFPQASQQAPAASAKISAILAGAPGVVRGYFWTMFGMAAFSFLCMIGNFFGLFFAIVGLDAAFDWSGIGPWMIYFFISIFCLNAVLRANRMTSAMLLASLSFGVIVYAVTNVFFDFYRLSQGSVFGGFGNGIVLIASGACAVLILLPSAKQWFAPVQE